MSGETLNAFYSNRANYLFTTYPQIAKNYFKEVAGEFEKLQAAKGPAEFNLWFGYDLFCQTNMWFVLYSLNALPIDKQIFVVYPSFLAESDIWLDYGNATPDQLIYCYKNKIAFTDKDLELGAKLWSAYKKNDLTALMHLSNVHSICFPYLKEVCEAHIERFEGDKMRGRPEGVIEELMAGGTREFHLLFDAFSKREGVYGFSDLQVKKLYDKALQKL